MRLYVYVMACLISASALGADAQQPAATSATPVAKPSGATVLAARSVALRWQHVLEAIVAYAKEHHVLDGSLASLYNAVKNGGALPKLAEIKVALEHINHIFVAAKIQVRPLVVAFEAHIKHLQERGLTDEKDITLRALRSTLMRLPVPAKVTRSPRPDASPASYPPWGGQDSASLKNLAVSVGTALNGSTAVTGTFNVNGYNFPAQDGAANTVLTTNGAGQLSFSNTAGTGDVVGPNGASDRAIVLFNGASGKIIKNSSASIMDDGTVFVDKLSVAGAGTTDALNVNGATTIYDALTVRGATTLSTDGAAGNVAIGNDMGESTITGQSITLDGAGTWWFLGDYTPYVILNDTPEDQGAQLGCDDGIIGAQVQALPGQLNLNTYDLAEGAATQIGNNAIGSTVGIGGPADPGRAGSRVPGGYELKVTGDSWLTGNLQVDGISSLMPAGGMVAFVTGASPTGFLSCDGASYATADYPNLFGAIGYTFGGSGANFNVPSATPGFAHGQYLIKT